MPPPDPDTRDTLKAAALLALGAAVALGLARFSYALLLPPMRDDLGWTYATAGAMNTVNAGGYLVGALAMPWLLQRLGPRQAFGLGSAATALLLAGHGLVRDDAALYALRLATGVASAAVFVSGGVLAARLSLSPRQGSGTGAGLVLGLYYGGTGLGIVACALVLPPLLALGTSGLGLPSAIADGMAAWQAGWLALAVLAALATLAIRRSVDAGPATGSGPTATGAAGRGASAGAGWRPFGFGLAGYFMFGLGYIGYMTFIVTLLREQRLGEATIAAFYALLGAGVVASPWLWAGLLQRHRDGRPLAVLNALLALATLLPVLPIPSGGLAQPVLVFVSGALFGAVFLSVVASTTALVRHNLPPAQWPAGISAFTVVFALGQIVGPSLVGWLADGPGGLRLGLAVSAGALALGAALAWRQKALGAR